MPRGGSYITWYGGQVLANQLELAKVVVTRLTREAAEIARANHPWQVRRTDQFTGDLEASIWADEARIEGLEVKGFWGAPPPALWLEMGTVKMAAFPFMRPAQDKAARLANFAGMGRTLGTGGFGGYTGKLVPPKVFLV